MSARNAPVYRGGLKPPAKKPPPRERPSHEPHGPIADGLLAGGAVSPVTVDGGTRFVLATEGHSPADSWGMLLHRLRSPDADDSCRIGVPSPTGERTPCEVTVSGTRRQLLTFHVRDQAWWRWNARTGELQLQLKAKLLWASGAGSAGYAIAARAWLGRLSWLFAGRDVELYDAAALGWRMTGLELCCDFVGLSFTRDDAARFVGARVTGDDGRQLDAKHGERVELWGRGASVETLNIGRRTTSNIALCIYDKCRQVDAAKGGDYSTYAAVWRACGWTERAPIVRVEWRFKGRGLTFENATTGEVLDFVDPATAADGDALRCLWSVACAKRRLVELASTRMTRNPTDPRWLVVSSVASDDVPAFADGLDREWRQARHVQADTHRERRRRAGRDGLRALARYACLHDIGVTTTAGEVDPMSAARFRRMLPDVLADMLGAAELDVGEYAAAYYLQQLDTLAPEMAEAGVEYLDRARARRL